MKSQKRHELQTNELADHLGRYLQAIQPYQNLVLFGAVAVVAIIGGVFWMSSQQAAKASASWSDYFRALGEQRADVLEGVAQDHSGSNAAWWALQSAGDIELANGAGMMYQDRDEARTNLKDAEKNFKKVEEGATKYPDLVRRARFGLGQVYETMCEVPKATDYYKQVAQSDPDSAIGKLAERRYKQLSDNSVEKWYNWFERQEPTPPTPPGGTGLNPLGDLENLPERPDLSFPSAGPLDQPLSDDSQTQAGPDLSPADQPSEPADSTGTPAEPPESAAPEAPAKDESEQAEPAQDQVSDEEMPADTEPVSEGPPAESSEEPSGEAAAQPDVPSPAADDTDAAEAEKSADPADQTAPKTEPEAEKTPEPESPPAERADAPESDVPAKPTESDSRDSEDPTPPADEQAAGSDESS